MFELMSEYGDVLFAGTYEECKRVLQAFVTYGIREDKFEIVG